MKWDAFVSSAITLAMAFTDVTNGIHCVIATAVRTRRYFKGILWDGRGSNPSFSSLQPITSEAEPAKRPLNSTRIVVRASYH